MSDKKITSQEIEELFTKAGLSDFDQVPPSYAANNARISIGGVSIEPYGFSELMQIKNQCDHDYVNVGFSQLKLVCKKCDDEQTED